MHTRLIGWFDGACEPQNPGGYATYGILLKLDSKTIVSRCGCVGYGKLMSNNVAEYVAIAELLGEVSKYDENAEIYGDSALVVNQLNRKWKIRGGLYRPYYEKAKALFDPLRQRIYLQWVPREENQECDELSKQAYAEACRSAAQYVS